MSEPKMSAFWHTDLPPSDDARRGEPLLTVWLGKVRMASWNTTVHPPNWQQWPDGDFACSPNEVTKWAYPEDLL